MLAVSSVDVAARPVMECVCSADPSAIAVAKLACRCVENVFATVVNIVCASALYPNVERFTDEGITANAECRCKYGGTDGGPKPGEVITVVHMV